MKITKVEAIPLKIGPMLVRVYTDEGLTGIGEASSRNWKVLKPFIEEFLGPLVIGQDPRQLNQCWEAMFFGTSRLGPMGFDHTNSRLSFPGRKKTSTPSMRSL